MKIVDILVLASVVTLVTAPANARPASSAPPLPPPGNTIVNVSTESQLQAAVRSLASNTTILIAPGTYRLTATLSIRNVVDVALRGSSGRRDDVVIVGPGMSNSSYGSSKFGIWAGSTQRLTIADLTVRDFYSHCIILNAGVETPRFYNLRLADCGAQMIKSNPDGAGGGVDNAVVEYSVFEYTTRARSYYTSGIDVHTGRNWLIRHNLFRNFIAPAGQVADPAILIWNSSSGTVAEGNTLVNCQRGIAFGLMDRTPNDHSGGIIRNNFIYRSASVPGYTLISVNDSPNTDILHNTVIASGRSSAIEYRFPQTTGVIVANNLADARVWIRDGASGSQYANYTAATTAMFVNAEAGDLHLTAGAAPAIDRGLSVADAAEDWDGNARPMGGAPDIGADEFGTGGANASPSVSVTSPSSGAAFTAPASIAISATAGDSDGVVTGVSFYNGSTLIGTDANAPYGITWSGVGPGTYTLTAVTVDDDGASTTSNAVTISVSASSTSDLPAPWVSHDIGSVAAQGRTVHSNGTFTMDASGADIWGTADEFHFMYQTLNGNREIVARVEGVEHTDPWAKAGVMIRETLQPGSRHAAVVVTPGNGVSFPRRLTTGGVSSSTPGAAVTAPYWVKLTRSGTAFSAFHSADGINWILVGSVTISMADAVYVGLATTSHNDGMVCTAVFSNVSLR